MNPLPEPQGRRRRRWPLVAAFAAIAMLLIAPAAFANQADINSSGPLTDIWESDSLLCQVVYQGQGGQFYEGENGPASCMTGLRVGGTTYSPYFGTQFTPVSQTGVTGSGTTADPYRTVTVADVGSTGLRVTQTDSYVVGQEGYRIDMEVSNSGSSDVSAILYHAGDCYVAGDDHGYGYVDTAHGAVACSVNANNDPPALVQEFYPFSPGSHYREGGYFNVYTYLINGNEFDDTCDCTTHEDNGMGLSWAITVPAGGSVTRSLFTVASPTGVTEPPAAETTPTPEPTPGPTVAPAPIVETPLPPGMRLSHRNVVVRNGKAIITLRCGSQSRLACTGTLLLQPTKFANRRQALAAAAKATRPVRYSIPPGTNKTLRVPIPKASRTRIARVRKAVAVAVFTITGADGKFTTSQLALTLLKPKF
jgi:hypothetical protein